MNFRTAETFRVLPDARAVLLCISKVFLLVFGSTETTLYQFVKKTVIVFSVSFVPQFHLLLYQLLSDAPLRLYNSNLAKEITIVLL